MATIVYGDFEWDDAKASVNHGVSFEEASTVFDDPDALDRIRIIGARKATPAQRKKYEEDR